MSKLLNKKGGLGTTLSLALFVVVPSAALGVAISSCNFLGALRL